MSFKSNNINKACYLLMMLLLLLLLLSALLELHPLAQETPFALFKSGKVKRMMKTLKWMQPASGRQSLKTDLKREKKWLLHFITEQQSMFFCCCCCFFFYNLNQAIFVSRSTYEFLLFEVSVNWIEVKRLYWIGIGQGITGKLFF